MLADSLQQTSPEVLPAVVPHLHTWQVMPPLEHDTAAPHTVCPFTDAPFQYKLDSMRQAQRDSLSGHHYELGGPLYHNAFNDSLRQHLTRERFQPQGFVGDPLPYRFKNDDVVTIVILIAFFLIVKVLSRSSRYIMSHFKHLFTAPHTGRRFTEKTDEELSGQLFLVVQTCFTLGVLAFYYVQVRLPEVFTSVSPYVILLTASGIFGAYYLIKVLLYLLINRTFFGPEETEAWNDVYMLSVLFLGVCLFPVALLVVYFDLNDVVVWRLLIAIGIGSKMLLVAKGRNIFSQLKFRFFHIILYLCTLEILPLLVLWRTLNYALHALVAID